MLIEHREKTRTNYVIFRTRLISSESCRLYHSKLKSSTNPLEFNYSWRISSGDNYVNESTLTPKLGVPTKTKIQIEDLSMSVISCHQLDAINE